MTRGTAEFASPLALRRHDHAGWFFDGADGFDDIAVPFLRAALARGETAVYCTDDPSPARLGALGDVEELIERRALVLRSTAELYGTDGSFDPASLYASSRARLAAIFDGDCSGMCAATDATAPATARGASESWITWEMLGDRLAEEFPVTFLCGFDRQRVLTATAAALASVHSVVPAGSPPAFRLVHEGGLWALVGAVDGLDRGHFQRVIGALPGEEPIILDLARAHFVGHGALSALGELARTRGTIALRSARPVIGALLEILGIGPDLVRLEAPR